jgi:hypothetical protein
MVTSRWDKQCALPGRNLRTAEGRKEKELDKGHAVDVLRKQAAACPAQSG